MRRATYVGQRLRKFSLFELSGADRGSMSRVWSVTQPAHRAALSRLGPCPEHRRSYAPVREAMQGPDLFAECEPVLAGAC